MKRFSISAILALAVMVAVGTAAHAQPKVVTFDYGTEGWTANPDFEQILNDGDEHGNYWNFTTIDYENNVYNLRGWYDVRTDNDPAFIGDYTRKGEVRICVDVNVNSYTLWGFMGPMQVDEWREVAIVLRDTDMQYYDPEVSPYPWPWAEAQFMAGYLPNRNDGWATYCADVTDLDSSEPPAGWSGYGGPENPDTYMPQFPPGYGWSDLLQGVDEVRINSVLHGWFYSLNFTHDLNFDNISIGPIPCAGQEPTIFVSNGIVYGGPENGKRYNGVLKGTNGNDVMAGTGGMDTILGFDGHDIICGRGGDDQIKGSFGDDMIDGGPGNDTVNGQQGNDFLNGGEGRDNMNGGPGTDTCVGGEVFNMCGPSVATPNLADDTDHFSSSSELGGPSDAALTTMEENVTDETPRRALHPLQRSDRTPRSR